MIEITNTVLPSPAQWEFAVREMVGLNDSYKTVIEDAETHETAGFEFFIGEKDLQSITRLMNYENRGLRMLPVLLSVNAPLYFWREFESFRFGSSLYFEKIETAVRKSAFTDADFSTDEMQLLATDTVKQKIVPLLRMYTEQARAAYRPYGDETKEETAARCDSYMQTVMHMLPPCFMHKRNIMLNYATLRTIYKATQGSKLKEWETVREWIEGLPYAAEFLTGGANETY